MNVTVAVALGYIRYKMKHNNRTPRITSEDIDHMNAFPVNRREKILEKIMSRLPATSAEFTGNNQYEKMLLTLRRDDFRLIDLQPQEFMLTSVWCRKTRSVIGLPGLEVVMLMWVVEEDLTTLRTWRL
jgi:hypothetical protein